MSNTSLTEGKDRLEEAVRASLSGGYLPCAVALKLATRLNVEAGTIGETTDRLGIRITDCQLGCFKVAKARRDNLEDKVINQKVTQGIYGSMVDGRLPCKAAHDLGRKTKVSLREIGDAATKLKIKISRCQLNCFP